jgi:hypothetical protein
VTNPRVARAVAREYLEELYKAAGWPVTPELVDLLVGHTFDNIREGEDGYPVVKVVGKNRLQMEFDLDAKLIKPTPDPTSEDGVVDATIEGDAGPEHSDGYVLPGEDEPDADPIPAGDLPPRDAHEDLGVSGKQAAEGFRSPWMDEGDRTVANSAASATD